MAATKATITQFLPAEMEFQSLFLVFSNTSLLILMEIVCKLVTLKGSL